MGEDTATSWTNAQCPNGGNDQTAKWSPISKKDPNNELYPKHRNQLLYVGRQISKKLWQLCGNSGRVLYRWRIEFGICFLLGNKSRMQLTLRFHTLLLGWIFASR